MPKKSRSLPRSRKRWVARVTTDSTHPPKRLFTKDPSTVARTLASRKVSPKGPASGMRMLTYFINRGGRGLSASRRKKLERAKTLLSARIHGRQRKPSSARPKIRLSVCPVRSLSLFQYETAISSWHSFPRPRLVSTRVLI